MTETIGDRISKIVMAVLGVLLIISFATWGIGDVLRGGGNGKAAKVGKEIIPLDTYQRAVYLESQRVQATLGKILSEEQLLNFGIPQQALTTLINQKMLEQETNYLGIKVPDSYVTEAVRNNNTFRIDAAFNRDIFDSYLKQRGVTEEIFVSGIRSDLAGDTLINALTANPIALTKQIALLATHDGEQREATLLKIPADYIKKVEEPNEDVLKIFYEKEKSRFSAPEYRSISYIELTTKDAEKEMDLSEEMLKAEFAIREDNYTAHEIRSLDQIVVQDEDKATKAHSLLKEKSFSEIAEEIAGIKGDAIRYGDVTQQQLTEAGVFKPEDITHIFSLDKGQHSDPIESLVGWHIYKIADIKKGKAKTFDDVKDELQQALLDEQAPDILYNLSIELDDAIAGGASLKEAAEMLGLKVNTIPAIDISGKAQDGTEITIPSYGDFLASAFAKSEKETSLTVSNPSGNGYYIYNINNIIDPRIKVLDEVKGAVIEAWKAEQKRHRLLELARTHADQLAKGKATLESVAKTLKLKVDKPEIIYRHTNDPTIWPAELVDELFRLDIGKSSKLYGREDGSYVIGRLEAIIPLHDDDKSLRKDSIRHKLEEQATQDLIEQYFLYLNQRYPVIPYVNFGQ